jgi:3-carboxy-cis,cis-muconate cycloisomerase
VAEPGLLSGLFSRGAVADEVSDLALLKAMLDVELALSRALVHARLAPPEAAEELSQAVLDPSTFDLDELGRATGEQGTPVPGLLSVLRARLSDEAAAYLHIGATSQDVLDTAVMLVAKRALQPLLQDLADAADACALLVETHRDALMPGRTLLQHALPLTFGLKVAGWLTALDAARRDLAYVRDRVLALQLGGAVGTLASLGDDGLEVVADVAAGLGLAEPELPWHTVRLRPARLAYALGAALGVIGKIARDIVLLAQTEVAEVVEGGDEGYGGSSTMPHKHNPVGAVAAIACSQRAPGLVATMLSAMVQEHERAAGAWQAEWETLLDLLRLAGSAASSLNGTLAVLDVDTARMRADLDLTGGVVMTESAAAALAPVVGRQAARRLVERAARQAVAEHRPFRETMLELSSSLDPPRLDEALDPRRYLGAAQQLIDRALAAHRERPEP